MFKDAMKKVRGKRKSIMEQFKEFNEKLFNKQALFDCCRKKYLKLL